MIINICLLFLARVCILCSGKHGLHNVTNPAAILFTLDLKHMESTLERTENAFWLEVIRKGLKLSQEEIIESDWGGE